MKTNAVPVSVDLTPSPLEALTSSLSGDMVEVNRVILTRMQSDVPLIPQLAGYLIASGGKRIRPLMTLAATRLFDATTQRPYALAASVEFIHTATLLHDDVVDESDLRRGKPTANTVFGNQSAVLVGDFLFSRAFELMVEDGSLDVLRILSRASAVISEGEVLQLSIQNKLDTTIDQYIAVIGAKTAALFAAACEIGPVVAGQPPAIIAALKDYGYYLGMAFQIADDILDYEANEAQLGKSVGDDFKEGKMTAPVIFALENADTADRAFWERTFVNHDYSDADLGTAQTILNTSGATDKTRTLAHSYIDKAVASLVLVPTSALKTTLEQLAFYVLARKT